MDNKRHSRFTHTVIWLRCLIALIISTDMPAAIPAETTISVYIITTPDSNYQKRVANTLIEKLSTRGIDISNIPVSELDKLTPDGNDLFITFAGPSSDRVKQMYDDNPQLDITYNRTHLEPSTGHKQSALILAQSACRQITFIRKLVPAWKSAGIITSKNSSKQIEDIRQCAAQQGITILTYHVANEKELIQILETAVVQNDVLLALADTVVYNSHTVKNILLTAYRHRKPVIGYSNSLVKAGAVAAIYTSAEDASAEAAEIIQEYISANGCFNRSIYTPSAFTVSINRQVARALEIDLDSNLDFNDDLDLLEIR